MTYTKTSILVSIVYATAFCIIAIILLYYTGLTYTWQLGKHLELSMYLWLVNFLLINLMFYTANVSKQPRK